MIGQVIFRRKGRMLEMEGYGIGTCGGWFTRSVVQMIRKRGAMNLRECVLTNLGHMCVCIDLPRKQPGCETCSYLG